MRLIDVDESSSLLLRMAQNYRKIGLEKVAEEYEAIASLLCKPVCFPSVDAVPVVRCKDCRYRGSSYGCPLRTLVHTEGRGYHYADMTTDTGYCSYGVRKEAGE